MIHILILLTVSGIIAYLGDVLGTIVGKRRLTMFGLRPRITALFVAIGTGMLITLLTLTVAAMLSENVRIALFSVQQLTDERDTLQSETAGLARERDRLASSVEDLQRRVRIKEQGLVVFRKDEPIAARVIGGGRETKEVMKDLTDFVIMLAGRARDRGLRVKDEITFFTENREQLFYLASHLASASGNLVVAAVADENIHIGEDLGQVRFRVRPNLLVFPSGQEIAVLEVDGRQEREHIARILQGFMDELNQEVVKRGMIGHPLTGRFFGDMTSESMLSFYDTVMRIKSLNRRLLMIAVVQEDTYAIGPLHVSFQLEDINEDSTKESAEGSIGHNALSSTDGDVPGCRPDSEGLQGTCKREALIERERHDP